MATSAQALARMGVPLFAGRLLPDGRPDTEDRRWRIWQKTKPGRVPARHKGDALCAVSGVVYDVIDIDPRHGGDMSLRRLQRDLGDDFPVIYWKVKTASGGWHMYIAPLGIRKAISFLPGLDYLGGDEEGQGRSPIFLPPTIRPSKETGVPTPYRPAGQPVPPEGSGSDALRAYIERHRAEQSPSGGSGRVPASELRAACIAAEGGRQRPCALRYVHELERLGFGGDEIVAACMSMSLTEYDPKWPWTEEAFRKLLHKPGEVTPDATPEEAEELASLKDADLIPAGLTTPLSEVEDQKVTWLWPGYLALGKMTLLDGDKGQGKTFVWADIAARGSRGDPMPDDSGGGEPFNTVIFTRESKEEARPRLLAAGADMSRVFIANLPKPKRGESLDKSALPGGDAWIKKVIKSCDAGLAIWDPITDFLDETIQTHNDASVRRALSPLGDVLEDTGCAALLIRHMNKDKNADARFRGGGTTAFQNRARVHLVTGKMPEGSEGMFGLAMVGANLRAMVGGTLAYSILDSEVPLDDDGAFIGCLEWNGIQEVEANALTRGDRPKRGPAPVGQKLVIEVLSELFSDRSEVPAKEAQDALKEAGAPDKGPTVIKAREEMNVRTHRRGGAWVWSIEKERISTNA